jgi:hypothetical protein
VLSLDWDRKGRVTPVSTKSQEAWPGAEPGCQSPGENRCGAPEGERAPKVRASAPEASTSGNACRCARTTMKFAPLGAPLPRLACEGCKELPLSFARLGRDCAASTLLLIRPREVKRSRGRGTTEGWWRGHAEWPSFQRKSSASSRPHRRAPGEKTHLSPTPLSGCEIARCLMRLRAPMPTGRVRGTLARVR